MLSPQILSTIEALITGDRHALNNALKLSGKEMGVLMDLERKLKALREATVTDYLVGFEQIQTPKKPDIPDRLKTERDYLNQAADVSDLRLLRTQMGLVHEELKLHRQNRIEVKNAIKELSDSFDKSSKLVNALSAEIDTMHKQSIQARRTKKSRHVKKRRTNDIPRTAKQNRHTD